MGPFCVYAWQNYQGTVGYCTGNCAVSETIDTQQQWERFGTALMTDVLSGGDPATDIVVDFGLHVGWYSVTAAKLGYKVFAWETDPENISVAKRNAATHGCELTVTNAWVDETLPPFDTEDRRVRFLKADIEGNEQHAIAAFDHMFATRSVDAAMVEISPVFNGSYPDLVEHICGYGYDVCWVPDGSFADLPEFFESPVEFVRSRWTIPAEGRREMVSGLHQADFVFFPTEQGQR